VILIWSFYNSIMSNVRYNDEFTIEIRIDRLQGKFKKLI